MFSKRDDFIKALFLSCGHWHQLQFFADEIKTGKIDLLAHFSELLPHSGSCIGLLGAQNGILTSLPEFREMGQSIVDKIPEGTLFLGMYNPSYSAIKDGKRVKQEMKGVETPIVRFTSQMMGAIAETIHKINPALGWLEARHSEGGVIGRRAIERLTQDQKNILKEQYNCIALGPAMLMPDSYGQSIYNIYSELDYVTKHAAKKQSDGFAYNVKFVECISSIWQKTAWIADHAFMGATYQGVLDVEFDKMRQKRGFYDGNKR